MYNTSETEAEVRWSVVCEGVRVCEKGRRKCVKV